MSHDFDLIVIGAGSGGVRAARMAAAKGIKVAVVEAGAFGGTCVNAGCVPKKLFSYAAQFSSSFKESIGFGWQVDVKSHEWETLIAHKNQEISRLNQVYLKLLENAGVVIFKGHASFIDSASIQVVSSDEPPLQLTANKFLVAVGGVPVVPDNINREHVITSDQVFYLTERPSRIVIVGGGYIALEFASIFNGLGSEVHLVHRSDTVLKHFDQGSVTFALNEMQKKGVNIHLNKAIKTIQLEANVYRCETETGEVFYADKVLYGIGRKPATQGLALQNTQVKLRAKGVIEVDDHFQTHQSSIFALGDVIGTPELTPVALEQAMCFVDQQFGHKQKTMSYHAIPTTIFCHPNMATVGLSEEDVIAKGIKANVYLSEFRPLKHTLSGSDERMMLKMIVDQDSQQVLGVHIVGSDAGEILQGFAVAVKAGLTKQHIDATIGIHPTAAEELVTLREVKYQVGV